MELRPRVTTPAGLMHQMVCGQDTAVVAVVCSAGGSTHSTSNLMDAANSSTICLAWSRDMNKRVAGRLCVMAATLT